MKCRYFKISKIYVCQLLCTFYPLTPLKALSNHWKGHQILSSLIGTYLLWGKIPQSAKKWSKGHEISKFLEFVSFWSFFCHRDDILHENPIVFHFLAISPIQKHIPTIKMADLLTNFLTYIHDLVRPFFMTDFQNIKTFIICVCQLVCTFYPLTPLKGRSNHWKGHQILPCLIGMYLVWGKYLRSARKWSKGHELPKFIEFVSFWSFFVTGMIFYKKTQLYSISLPFHQFRNISPL